MRLHGDKLLTGSFRRGCCKAAPSIMNTSVYSYNCVIFLWKLCGRSRFPWKALIHGRRPALSSAFFKRGHLVPLSETAEVYCSGECKGTRLSGTNMDLFVRAPPFRQLFRAIVHSTQRAANVFSKCLALPSRAKTLSYCQGQPYSVAWLPGDFGTMFILGQAAPPQLRPSRVWDVFDTSSPDSRLRGLARTCVMWVKGCPVEREPFSSAPAPYLSVCPLHFPPCLFASATPSTLFLLFFS